MAWTAWRLLANRKEWFDDRFDYEGPACYELGTGGPRGGAIQAHYIGERKFVGKNPWFILSAKYGLVPPRRIIAPYKKTLLHMSREDRKKWSEGVLTDIKKKIPISETLVVLAEVHYREFLVPALESCGYSVKAPMVGLPLGTQLQWLNRRGPTVQG